ncbi:MAG: DUF2652 domain-containing protein [Gammaproteobacteria bacterium]|nr:DUF2652 domain-containing protein [Gammaproteobacteria bacterium]
MSEMQGGGFHWPLVVMIVILMLAAVGIVFLMRYFIRPIDVSTLGSARVAELDNPPPGDPPADIERDTYVVIPDISGYTRFMQLTRFAAGHAQFVVAQLLDTLITAARPSLSPTRVEGDSVMFYAVSDRADPTQGASGPIVAAAVRDMVTSFYRKRAELLAGNLCPCEACKHITGLDLKVVVHRGDIVRYRLRGLEDLSGIAVIEAHRLLKNSVGRDRYVLVSEAAAGDVRLPWNLAPEQHREHYDGVGEVRCDLYPLEEEPVPLSEVARSPVRDMAGKLASNVQAVTGIAR